MAVEVRVLGDQQRPQEEGRHLGERDEVRRLGRDEDRGRPAVACRRAMHEGAREARERAREARGRGEVEPLRHDETRRRAQPPRHVCRERRRAEILGGEIEAGRGEQPREVHPRNLEREVDPRVPQAAVDAEPPHGVDGPGHDQQPVGHERALARPDRGGGVHLDVGRRAERRLPAAGTAQLPERRHGETARATLHDCAHGVVLLLDARLAVERPGIEHRTPTQQDAQRPREGCIRGPSVDDGSRRDLAKRSSSAPPSAFRANRTSPAAARSPNARAPGRPGRPPAGSRRPPPPRRSPRARSARAARAVAGDRGHGSRPGSVGLRAGPRAARA